MATPDSIPNDDEERHPKGSSKSLRVASRMLLAGVGVCVAWALLLLLGEFFDWLQTPSAEKLRLSSNPSRAFIVKEADIRGLFGNYDVDSAIYEYTTSSDSDRFWTQLQHQAERDGWQPVTDGGNALRFQRVQVATGDQACHYVEEVRVVRESMSPRVIVAWAKARATRNDGIPSSFPQHTAEGRFVSRVVWPQFNEFAHLAQPDD